MKKNHPRASSLPLFPSAIDPRAQRGNNLPPRRAPRLPTPPLLVQAAKLAQAFQKQLQRATTPAQRAAADDHLREIEAGWNALAPRLRAEGAAWERLRAKLRTQLRRELGRTFSRRQRLEMLRRLRQRQLESLLAKWPRPDGNVAAPAGPSPSVFTAPFPLHDVHTETDQGGHIKFVDRSFVLPETGQLIIDSDLDNNEHTSFSDGLWGLLYVNGGQVLSSCGTPYTVPASGPLRITVDLVNFYNHVTMTLTDNFGFSSASLWTFADVVISVLRPNRTEVIRHTLSSKHVTSGGGNRSEVLPDLEQGTVVTTSRITDKTYETGELVWIMAGMSVWVTSVLDDMHSHVRPLIWSQLKQITVEMA